MSSKKLYQSKCTQLTLLQSRIESHGSRMWQLPLTYLGGIALAVASIPKDGLNISNHLLFGFLSILGVAMLFALYGAYEGYTRACNNLKLLESDLGLSMTTAAPKSHTIPYFAIMGMGVILCVVCAIYLG